MRFSATTRSNNGFKQNSLASRSCSDRFEPWNAQDESNERWVWGSVFSSCSPMDVG